MKQNAGRSRKVLLYSVLTLALILFTDIPFGRMLNAGQEITYNVFNDIKNLNRTVREKAYVSEEDHYIVLLTAETHVEYMRDKYGLIVWYEYKNKNFRTKYCLIKNREEELFFTESLDELLKELRKIPSGNKIYSYSMTCGGPKDVAYVGEDELNLKPRRIDSKVYNTIRTTCKTAGSRFINYEFDKSEKRVICTCP